MPDLIVSTFIDDFMRSATTGEGRLVLKLSRGSPLVSAPIVPIDLSLGTSFRLTLLNNATIANPHGLEFDETPSFKVHITQGAGGPYVLSFGTLYKSPGGVPMVLTPTVGARDTLTCYGDGTILRCTMTHDYR